MAFLPWSVTCSPRAWTTYVARKGPLSFISIEAGQGPNAEPTVRKMSRKVKTDIALMQSRAYASAVLGRGDACEGS